VLPSTSDTIQLEIFGQTLCMIAKPCLFLACTEAAIWSCFLEESLESGRKVGDFEDIPIPQQGRWKRDNLKCVNTKDSRQHFSGCSFLT